MHCTGQPHSFHSMAQVPPFGTHQWIHSIPQMMPWTLGQQPQNIVQFTGQGNASIFQTAPTPASSPTPFIGTPNGHAASQLPNISLATASSPRVPLNNPSTSVKRYSELDEEVQILQPSPKVHVTADKVTARLSRLCIGNSSTSESLPSSPEEEVCPVVEAFEVDEQSSDGPGLIVSDQLKSVLDAPSSDPLMGLGKHESDRICKAVVLWKPPRPLAVKVVSITEVDEDEKEVTEAPNKEYCADIEFEELTEDLEPMTD